MSIHDNKIFINKDHNILISGIKFFKLEPLEYGMTGNFWHNAERYGFEEIHREEWFKGNENYSEV